MQHPPLPEDEAERLAELERHEVLDTPPEGAFDDLTRLASRICETPVSLVSLVDEHRQWFKSRTGTEATETPREQAFCAHAILRPEELFVVEDSLQDRRFRDNPLATGDAPVRFYAGMPLVTSSGHALGTLCVIDHRPRRLSEAQRESLRILADQVVTQLELRRACRELEAERDRADRATAARDALLERLARDVRSPLDLLEGLGERLRDAELSPEQARHVERLEQSAATLRDGLESARAARDGTALPDPTGEH